MIAQQTSIDRQAGVRPLRWAAALIACLILSPGLTPARADDGPRKKVDKEKPAEVWYRGKRVDNRFGQRPESDDSLSTGALDIPAIDAPPIDEPTETIPEPPVEIPAPKAGKDDVEVIRLPQLSETELPAAPKPLRTEETRFAERLTAPTVAPPVQQVPPPWYFPPYPVTEPTLNATPAATDHPNESAAAAKHKLDISVQQATAVTDRGFENRIAHRLPLESEAQSQDDSLAVAQRWAAPITVAFVVAALTTICTMLVISLVITRRFRESVFRVELSNANMLSYGAAAPTPEATDEGAEEEEDRVDPLQPRGVATELFDLPLEALVEKTYHAKQQEEADEQEALTESMMQCLFEDNLKLREGIREAE